MMHQTVLLSSIRRMRHVANKEVRWCRSFSSTTNGNNSTTATRGTTTTTHDKNTDINSKNSPLDTTFAPTTSDSRSPFSGSVDGSSSISDRTTALEKVSSATKSAAKTSFLNETSYSNDAGNNSNDNVELSRSELRSVYVHPLSQIVLEYLQNYHHEWVVAKGLNHSLTLHRDGSFELKDTPPVCASMPRARSTPPMTSTIHEKDPSKNDVGPVVSTSISATVAMKQEKSNETRNKSKNEVTARVPTRSHHQQKEPQINASVRIIENNDNIRIWTSYDEQEKKHWMTVRRGVFRQRFLLQDNLLTAWQGNRGVSLPERLHEAVDEMIRALNRLDHRQQSPQPSTIGHQQWQQKGQRRFRKR